MMASSYLNLSPEPDLHPLYPFISHISALLSSHSGLSPAQKAELVAHCLVRACAFGELIVLQYLLSDPQAQIHVDLEMRDEDGLGLISIAIHGFGADSDRDVEREECVRLLVAQGADLRADKAGWTPLHHAALLSPPTLVSYLMTHGCSPFAVTRRNLTPLDVITAYSVLPGRDDVALLLEEAMRGEGWIGGRMEQKRRTLDRRLKQRGQQREVRKDIEKILSIDPAWWTSDSESLSVDSESEEDDEDDDDDNIYTPPLDYSSMLVFSPPSLPHIFDSLITNFQPSLRDPTPANALYLLARFACLTCDHTWLEDLIIGATDAIEETFFARTDDVACLVFWLYNTTIWLHLLQCDNSINEACEMLGSFQLIEEIINSVFVFIIRFAERRIDQLFDAALLDFSPLASESESVQFESEWSFLRPFVTKRRVAASGSASSGNTPSRARAPSSPPIPERPLSPSQGQGIMPSSTSRSFSSLRQSFIRTRPNTPLSSLFPDSAPSPTPVDITSFLTALHTLLTLSDINPALTTQVWSQVMYWTSCEIFNRVITRKKYICRSRALQISINLGVLENWIEKMELPPGIRIHFLPVRDLLNWLQECCFLGLSSVTEFSELVATVQTLKSINPLQMRRAVRDYKYEINEGKMSDECIQYLTQLQKDWERHRVKLGVEALRKEMVDREQEDTSSSYADESPDNSSGQISSILTTSETSAAQCNVDMLFGTSHEMLLWEPIRPSPALGELLDSRYMLPLSFPSDPRMLGAVPRRFLPSDDGQRNHTAQLSPHVQSNGRRHRSHKRMPWKSRNKTLREIDAGTLRWVDGVKSAARWVGPIEVKEEESQDPSRASGDHSVDDEVEPRINVHITPLTRKPSGRNKARHSIGEITPIESL